MELSKPHGGEAWTRLANGIEAGVVGGLAMLVLMVSQSFWEGHVWWEVPNLLGSTFYGPRAFRAGASLATISGIAFHFVITGTLGGVFGFVFGGIQRRGRLILLGIIASIGWYNFANATLWPRINPWVPVASPRPATVLSHLLLGACLGYMGRRQQADQTSAGGIASPIPGLVQPEPEPVLVASSGLAEEANLTQLPVTDLQVRDLALPLSPVYVPKTAGSAEFAQPPAAASPDGLE